MKYSFTLVLVALFAIFQGCRSTTQVTENVQQPAIAPQTTPSAAPAPSPAVPNLQAEILDERYRSTNSPIGAFDFKNYTYDLPRGWQNPDGSTDITLVNGKLAPYEGTNFSDQMSEDEKAEQKSRRRIGLSYVTTRYMDINGDGEDEAVVLLKIETGGSAVPQIGFIYGWKNGKPELLYPFRTGDRADGGLKDLRIESGQLVVELYGQDRFLLGGAETGKITDDREQLCCPTYFTRSFYRWNGSTLQMQGKRLTYSTADPSAAPEENLGDKVNAPKERK